MQNENPNLAQDLIQELKCGKIIAVHDRLNNYSIEELEKITIMEWNPCSEETLFNMLFKMTAFCRKKKIDEQFEFNQENIHAIIRLDQALKDCCRRLKDEAENQFIHLSERAEENPDRYHFFIDTCIKIGTMKCFNPFLDCSHDIYESLFSFSIYENEDLGGLGDFKKLPIFDFVTNYADKITNTNMLAEHHIGYGFYTFYSESLLSKHKK
jgi:hypothetical protein